MAYGKVTFLLRVYSTNLEAFLVSWGNWRCREVFLLEVPRGALCGHEREFGHSGRQLSARGTVANRCKSSLATLTSDKLPVCLTFVV